jgi:hypothetical protein
MARKIVFEDEVANITAAHTHTGPLTVNANFQHSGGTIGFYGATPVATRSSTGSFHSTSWVSVSSNITVGSALAAWVTEVTATLVALGIWT